MGCDRFRRNCAASDHPRRFCYRAKCPSGCRLRDECRRPIRRLPNNLAPSLPTALDDCWPVTLMQCMSPARCRHILRRCLRAPRRASMSCAKSRLGRTVAEAEEMSVACRQAGVQLGAAFMMRFQSQHQAAAKMIQEGQLGQPVFARAQLSCWYPPIPGAWRQDPALGGGGSLIDLGSHCIDLLEMFFGPVKEVSCFARQSIHSYASEDSAVTMLQFANGALGSVDTFFCIQDDSSKNALELYGSKGSILATGTIGQGSQGDMTAYLQPGSHGLRGAAGAGRRSGGQSYARTAEYLSRRN